MHNTAPSGLASSIWAGPEVCNTAQSGLVSSIRLSGRPRGVLALCEAGHARATRGRSVWPKLALPSVFTSDGRGLRHGTRRARPLMCTHATISDKAHQRQ